MDARSNRRMRMGAALAIGLAAATGAAAQVADYSAFVIPDGASERMISAGHFACMAERGHTAEGSSTCVEAELARLETWLALATALADPQATATQAEWAATLGATCDAVAALESAEMAPLVRDGCRLDETVRRILWLDARARAR